MSDDQDDASDELGKTGEKMGGIADRFGKTPETTEMQETSETTETNETSETIETTEEDSASSSDMSETTDTTEMTETIETTETENTTDALSPGDEGFVLREDWNGRTIYLPDDVVEELDIRYSEANVEWQRVHGEQLPKNERFYPALVWAAINETSIEDELGLSE